VGEIFSEMFTENHIPDILQTLSNKYAIPGNACGAEQATWLMNVILLGQTQGGKYLNVES
jgi:hypothetical protein